jgi:hypothetical protein
MQTAGENEDPMIDRDLMIGTGLILLGMWAWYHHCFWFFHKWGYPPTGGLSRDRCERCGTLRYKNRWKGWHATKFIPWRASGATRIEDPAPAGGLPTPKLPTNLPPDTVLILNSMILRIWREVANGRGGHGDFLRSFADAVVRADEDNFALIRPAAAALVIKYHLSEYLDKAAEE